MSRFGDSGRDAVLSSKASIGPTSLVPMRLKAQKLINYVDYIKKIEFSFNSLN
jgi:hypothetical protein